MVPKVPVKVPPNYKTKGGPFQNNPKNLDQSRMTDPNFLFFLTGKNPF